MPAYNAATTLEQTMASLPPIFNEVLLCDDASGDETISVSNRLGLTTLSHATNQGYGGNQKTLYSEALKRNPDIVIMVHPDNQYDTSRLMEMVDRIRIDGLAMILGSRMKNARMNGMPIWKYAGNRFLSFMQNTVFGSHLSEFHSGLRAYDVRALRLVPYERFSNEFGFDSEMIAWLTANHYKIGEIFTDSYYTKKSSSVNFFDSVRYGLFTLCTLGRFLRGSYRK